MKKAAGIAIPVIALVLAAAFVMAHPHFNKSVACKVGGADVTLTYVTAPANESHIANVKVGDYTKSFANMSLSADVTVGGTTLAAGDYNVGAIKNNHDGTDWSMALHKGKLGFRDAPTAANVIKLTSMFSMDNGKAEHLYFDIAPGAGKMSGKVVLIWHFGSYYLAGQLQ